MKKISIIVPVYKVEKYLNTCIDSIINQTYKSVEIILVDDGSPDNCPKMCDELAKKDNRIKVIHKKNGGLSDARNVGIEASTGDYIGFVDSDDVISVDMYYTLVELLENNDADISICKFERFFENEKPNYTICNEFFKLEKSNAIRDLLIDKLSSHMCNKLFKKELFENINFPVGKSYEDAYIFYKLLLKTNKIVITNSKLYGYLQRAESITNVCSVKSVEDYITFLNNAYDDLKKYEELSKYLAIFKLRNSYIMHVKAAATYNEEFYFSNMLLEEYKNFKKIMKFKYFFKYLKNGNYKTKVYKIILLINRKAFWNIINRRRRKII